MEKVTIDEVDTQPNPLRVHEIRRPVSAALGTTDVAMNYFELQPGESFSGGLHTHHDQEEIFYIESGVATFDVGIDRETVRVAAGEVIRFAPGEFQTGSVPADGEPVVGWAIGAPGSRHDWGALESVVPCRECGEETIHATTLTEEARFQFRCTDCETSFTL